jgi:hypothetical protein
MTPPHADPPRHFRLPPQDVWDRFLANFSEAAICFDRNLPSPDPGWSNEQYAVSRVWAALDGMIAELSTSEEIWAITRRLSEAFEHLRRGVVDPLFVPKLRIPGRKADMPMIWSRAHLLRLLDENAGPADDEGLTGTADAIANAWRRAKPPKAYAVSGKALLNWHRQMRHPEGMADKFLAQTYGAIRPRPLATQAGSTIDERVIWIVRRLRDWTRNRQ